MPVCARLFVEDDEVQRTSTGKGRAVRTWCLTSCGLRRVGGAGSGGADEGGSAEESDPLYDQAVEFVLESRRASISAVEN